MSPESREVLEQILIHLERACGARVSRLHVLRARDLAKAALEADAKMTPTGELSA